MRVLAVDFGTSNTVAALAVDGGAPRLVAIDGSPLVPSSLFLTDDGTLAVGRDADRQARLDPSRFEPNPKRRIDEGDILLGSTPVPVVGAIAAVLGRVTGEIHRQLGGRPDQIRLTHPARWGRRRRDTLVAACREAGLANDPVLIPEPVAAATHFATLSGHGLADGSALAVYDLGGGTFDVAVVARRGSGYEVLAEAGLPDLGGLDFDHAIVEHIGRTHAAAADPEAWQQLLTPTDPASRRSARALATDVRDGKEALSRYPHVDIALPSPFADVHLTRQELEDLIRPSLQRSVDLMARTIADAGYAAGRLAGVYLVGGSSRIPLVARLIQESLGVTPTTLDQPETSVATGALYLPVGAAAPAAAGPVAPPTGPQPAVPRPAPFPSAAPVGSVPGGPLAGPLRPAAFTAPPNTPQHGPQHNGPPSGRPSGPSGAQQLSGPQPGGLQPGRPQQGGPQQGGPAPSGGPAPARLGVPAGPTVGSMPNPAPRPGPTPPGRPSGPVPLRPAGPGPTVPVRPPPQAAGSGGAGPGNAGLGVGQSGPIRPAAGPPGGPQSQSAPPGAPPRAAPPPTGPAPIGPPSRPTVVPGPRTGGAPASRPLGVPAANPAGPSRPPGSSGPAGVRPLQPSGRPIGQAPVGSPGTVPRPGGAPPGGPPSGPSGPGGPAGPGSPHRQQTSRRLFVIGAAAGLAVVLVVVAIVLASGGGGSGGTPTSPSPTLALSSSPTSTAPNTKFDEAFTSTKLRDYVRPYYDDIKSCDKTTTASFAAVQCQFTSGVSVIVFEVPTAITMTQLRTQVSALLPGAEKITWRSGQLWTSAATGRSTLYWDVEGERLAGIAVQAGGTVPGLRAWWEGRFGS